MILLSWHLRGNLPSGMRYFLLNLGQEARVTNWVICFGGRVKFPNSEYL